MIYLVTYATNKYLYSQKILEITALQNGVDKLVSYQRKDLIKTNFYVKNKNILDENRGAGYWLWKPYFILKTLKKLSKDDVLIYLDSGITVVKNILPLIKIANSNGRVLFAEGGLHLNSQYTKRDCFVYMNCDNAHFWNGSQILSSIQIYKKNNANIKFLKELLYYATNKYIITDHPNISGKSNFKNFIDHRHDQSILSLMALKHGDHFYRDPTQWGDNIVTLKKFSNSKYKTLFLHHRIKKTYIEYLIWKIKNLI